MLLLAATDACGQMLVALSEVIPGRYFLLVPSPHLDVGKQNLVSLRSGVSAPLTSLPDTAWHTGLTLSSSSHVTGSLQLFVPGLIHAGGQHRYIFK